MIPITKQDIKESVGASYYLRGFEYYTRKKVLDFRVHKTEGLDEDEYITITSKVKGSAGRIYQQEIEIYLDEDEYELDIVVIDGKCSCPISYDCKHVAAVCIAYQQEYLTKYLPNDTQLYKVESKQISLIDKWLLNIQTSNAINIPQSAKDTTLSQDYFLTYKLYATNSYEKNELSFYKSKILKNGSISRGSRLDTDKVIHGNSYNELKTEVDYDILKMASSFIPRTYYHESMELLSGTLGAMLLQRVIHTKRCFTEYHSNPIVMLDTIFEAKFEFKLYNGEYSLKSNIEAKGMRVIETQPPFLLDKNNNTIQELKIDLQVYKQLQNAPKIPKKDIAKVYTSIAKILPNIELKTPKAVQTQKIKTTPIPHLHLQYSEDADAKLFNSLHVKFQYNQYSVTYMPREEYASFFAQQEKIEIFRDLNKEKSAKEQLEAFGFVVTIQNETLHVALQTKKRQEQLKLWKLFLDEGIEQLKDDGWVIEMDEEFQLKFEPSSEIVVESEESNNWFNLSFNIEFNGVSQPIAPLVASIIEEFDSFDNMPELINIEVAPNHFVELPTKQIEPIIKTIIELFDKKDKDEALNISPYDAHLLEFMDDDIIWRGSKDILALSSKLKDFQGIEKVEPPECLTAELRDYQYDGLNWLNFLHEFGFGGILADDMGLGKTIQTLAHISRLKEEGKLNKPSLVVMPTSLIANWKNEAKRFTPNLQVLSLHGNDRAPRFAKIAGHDLILTTYALIVRDQEKFIKEKFAYIILDEAQKIKNHKTKMAIALKTFHSEHRLALSGTPIENHLGELWSIFSFLMPGFLDTNSFFRNYYQLPIEKEHNFGRQNILNRRIKPFMIRRTKERVAHELPEKTEIVKYTQFGDKQAKLYESIRVTMEKKVQEAVSAKGIGSSHITILDALLKLRQVCCDPSLLKIKEAQKLKESAKLELFLDLIDELLQEGRKILVFSQFTSMISIIEEKFNTKKIKYSKLTGATRKREEAIEEFTQGKADIFLISLKAGGVGLNLTAADTVIHYDPWWNPAVENQATDRAYRIGQDKAVFVYKLIVENSIEQRILELQKKKKQLQDGIYDDNQQQEDMKFGGNELMELLSNTTKLT